MLNFLKGECVEWWTAELCRQSKLQKQFLFSQFYQSAVKYCQKLKIFEIDKT